MAEQRRVTSGGMFHVQKVKYSPETHALLKELIRESKLSVVHRQGLEKCLRDGKPLPVAGRKGPRTKKKSQEEDLVIRSHTKRSLAAILTSGAYNTDQEYKQPKRQPVDYQKEKVRLQNLMAFGKNLPAEGDTSVKARVRMKRHDPYAQMNEQQLKEEIVQQLVREIKDRATFLKEMELLGEGERYRMLIQQEIAEKEYSIKKTDSQMYERIRKDLENWKP